MTTTRLTCAIHQPNLFPRLSTLAKLHAADIWIVLDDVQLNMRDYQHRARLLDPHDRHGQWLSLPVHRPEGRSTRINQAVLLDQTRSARRMRRLIQQYYGRCRRWPELQHVIDAVANMIQTSRSLVDVAESSTRLLLEDMGWHGRIARSSEFTVRQERSARLADLAGAVGASGYLCGAGGARYLDEIPFRKRHITVRYVGLSGIAAVHDHRQATGLWWLAAVGWADLQELLWNQTAA